MRILVTCGPTYEPLDEVRRLTNFSTGRLGIGLANFLHGAGHEVLVLKGYYATCPEFLQPQSSIFTTTQDLLEKMRAAARASFDAVFHAAAVSDFGFGKIFKRTSATALEPVTSGKFSTRDGNLLAELVPAPKLISHLRALFPGATIVGWKYEVEGNRDQSIALAARQIVDNRTDHCVVNGPAYGAGFGVVAQSGRIQDCVDAPALYAHLNAQIQRPG